jgi:hypothetical protein
MMEQVMAVVSTRGDGIPPPSLCPKCGLRPRRYIGGKCKSCATEAQRERRRRLQKNRSTSCGKCGARRPVGQKRECAKCAFNRAASYGEQRMREQFLGLADAISTAVAEPERLRLFANFYKNKFCRLPSPSQLFAGLDPKLDDRLIREHRNKDVVLGQALSAMPTCDQREFFELYLVDPADARHWAKLPTWKRPIRSGDKDDIQIWKFFTMQRLNMEQAAREAPPWSMASQGAQLPQMFGSIAYLTPEGFKRLVIVMTSYGTALQYGRELGDVVKKPWEEK